MTTYVTSEIAELLPEQGSWSEADYLWLTNHTNRLIEYTDGYIEVLPMPTRTHQKILRYLFLAFHAFLTPLGGAVFFAPLRLRLRSGKFREPDLLLLLSEDDLRNGEEYWTGADLVLEVVSPEDPSRDKQRKRKEYADVGIPEYWIVNPLDETIAVLRLDGGQYTEHGVFKRGDTAMSALIEGFVVGVNGVFDVK